MKRQNTVGRQAMGTGVENEEIKKNVWWKVYIKKFICSLWDKKGRYKGRCHDFGLHKPD